MRSSILLCVLKAPLDQSIKDIQQGSTKRCHRETTCCTTASDHTTGWGYCSSQPLQIDNTPTVPNMPHAHSIATYRVAQHLYKQAGVCVCGALLSPAHRYTSTCPAYILRLHSDFNHCFTPAACGTAPAAARPALSAALSPVQSSVHAAGR